MFSPRILPDYGSYLNFVLLPMVLDIVFFMSNPGNSDIALALAIVYSNTVLGFLLIPFSFFSSLNYFYLKCFV